MTRPGRVRAVLSWATSALELLALLAVVTVGLVVAAPSILAGPVEWALILAAMVMCSVFWVRVSASDSTPIAGIIAAMLGVLSPAVLLLPVLLVWAVGAFLGFVIRRRDVVEELRRVARLLLPAVVYLLVWRAISPEPDASLPLVIVAATAATACYAAIGVATVAASAALRGHRMRPWFRSLRWDLVGAMAVLNVVLCVVARSLTRFLETRSAEPVPDHLPSLEGILVITVLGAAAVVVDVVTEARVSRRRLDGIVDAATDLPWPAGTDQIAFAVAAATRTVEADRVTVETRPSGAIGTISAPLRLPDGSVVHLVAHRGVRRPPFFDLDRQALAALASIAAESMRTRSELGELEQESQTDSLTGLANYRGLQSALDRVRATRTAGQGMAVIYLDMDRFKQINDQYGHETGNEVLRAIAARLRSAVRPTDVVARVGGDEFLVLLAEVDDRAHAEAVGERIRRTATAPLTVGATTIPTGFSVGIAFTDDPAVDPAALVDRADVQMYQARGLRLPAEEGDEAPEGVDLAAVVEEAIRRERLLVHYQPIVDAASGIVTAVEALVRFRHEELGWLPPPLLVREARRLGMLPELTAQVLRTAFADVAAIGPGTGPVHVNIDVDEVTDDRFIALVAELRAAMPTVRLMLELGEDSLHRTGPDVVARLARLRDSGVQVALDDFGKAHSTMLAIAQVPVDAIKIDRSLIQGIEDARSRHLIASLARLASRLLMRVVVEGVETERERELLGGLGIAEMQGFLFARPMPADELAGYVAAATARALDHWRSGAAAPAPDWDDED